MIVNVIYNFISLYKMVSLLIQETVTNKVDDLGPLLEPEPIKFSFDTPGWYFLAFVTFLIILYSAILSIKKYRANHYRRAAIKSLDQLKIIKSNQATSAQVVDLLIILKKVALQTYGRKEVSALYGNAWLLFLESKAKNISFSKFQPLINKATYEDKPIQLNELNELKNLSIKWIRNHA